MAFDKTFVFLFYLACFAPMISWQQQSAGPIILDNFNLPAIFSVGQIAIEPINAVINFVLENTDRLIAEIGPYFDETLTYDLRQDLRAIDNLVRSIKPTPEGLREFLQALEILVNRLAKTLADDVAFKMHLLSVPAQGLVTGLQSALSLAQPAIATTVTALSAVLGITNFFG